MSQIWFLVLKFERWTPPAYALVGHDGPFRTFEEATTSCNAARNRRFYTIIVGIREAFLSRPLPGPLDDDSDVESLSSTDSE